MEEVKSPTNEFELLGDMEGQDSQESTNAEEEEFPSSNEQLYFGGLFPPSSSFYRGRPKPEDTSNNYRNVTADWKMSLSRSPIQNDDVNKYRLENNQLRLQVKQLNLDLQSEQESLSQVRRRLNAVEKERLEAATRSNAEISELESQVAKLRSQLEKGEATRQNLEFELTKCQREINHQRSSSYEKETKLTDFKDQLQAKISELTRDLQDTQHQLEIEKQGSKETEAQLKMSIEERNHSVSKCHTELDILRAERDKLDSLVLQHESAISEFSEKIQELESERKNQTENLRRTLTEIEYAKEREDRLKKDLEMSLQRLRTVEENIEAERAAHLETKFNSEIIQLRVRDLEGALEVEKSANDEANKAIDRLTKQIRELEHSYEEERRNNKDTNTKLDKLEKEYSSVKRQLTSEVENKKNVILNLSKELEVHQKNFNELKEELSKAKKRQIYLEETYGGSMRELELLLNNFQVDEKPKRASISKSKKDSKSTAPSSVLETLRVTLTEYKKRLDDTTEELVKMKKSSDALHKEIDQCKEMIWAKDKALEDAQKNYTRTAKELNRVRSEYSEMENSMAKMRITLQSSSSNSTKDRKRVQELSEEIMKLVKRHKADDEEKLAFLHGMYQRLLAGRVMVPPKDTSIHQFTWADLTSLVYEQMCNLVTTAQRTDEKIRHLEEAVRMKEDALDDMQKAHEDQLNKLTALTKEREIAWNKQKEEIEAHYSQLLNEIQSRSKKSQSMADQAWEKIRMTGTVQQGLETECSDLRNHLMEAQKQNRALLATCSLLAGALYPTFSRSSLLAIQRNMLEEQMSNWEFCRERMELLVTTLSAEMKAAAGEPSKLEKPAKRHPLLTFRVGVVAVLAANRLRFFGQNCNRMFVTYDTVISNMNGIVVCTGGVKSALKAFPGDTEERNTGEMHSAILQWLSSTELLNTATTSMSELLEVTDQIKGKEKASAVEMRAVVNAARNSFTKLVDKLCRQFEGISPHPGLGGRDRNSLIRVLGRGLSKICVGKSVDQKGQMVPAQELLGALQTHILDFTQRLHTVEVERRQLVLELGRMKDECADLPQKEDIERLQDQLSTIKGQDLDVVSIDKFESVCQELNNALQREQQAQQLLVEQSRQLEEITMRLDLYTTEGMEKEQTLSEAVHGLTETKGELKRKEQTLRQLNRQVISLEGEKKALLTNVADAEKALRTVARDKETLAQYLKAVTMALEQAKKELTLAKGITDFSWTKRLLNADFIPSDVGKAGPELIAAQNLVGAFVETQNQAISKIKSLEEEIDTHQQHINTLKRELSDAVRREYDESAEIPTRDHNRDMDMTQSESFLPIREDSEISFGMPKAATPKSKKLDSSLRRSERSPKFQTPVRSSRSTNIRPKAFEPHGR
ncbi:coiled-coil domain-containing protein 171-like isoform X2 [Saccostrea cucullata]|uniref:coiled-coil domain-containing protein 171-like isoform X2 n=1 Tax=Saccostrea cuccullata TaxID=36930 RepID=UPI002ED1C8BE